MKDEQPTQLQVFVSDATTVKEGFGFQGSGPDGVTNGVRVVDDRGQSMSADTGDEGKVSVRTEGKGISGRADELRTCQIIIDRMNSEGDHWSDAQRVETAHEN